MVVQFVDSVSGAAVYINPRYVVTLCPDPAERDPVSIVRIQDGESIRGA